MKKAVVIIGLAAVAAAIAWLVRSPSSEPSDRAQKPTGREVAPVKVEKPVRVAAKKDAGAVKARPKKAYQVRKNKKGALIKVAAGKMARPADDVYRDDDGKPYPEADQKLLRQAARAIETDDVKAARKLAAESMRSRNSAVRMAAVESLSWFGEKAVAELTMFLSDADAEIADAAKDGWMQGLMEVESDTEKAAVIKSALSGLKDREMLGEVANELVGLDDLIAMQTIVDVIQGNNPSAIPAAKEAYESLTSDEWTGVDAAEAWLKENYVSDDE